MKLLRIVELILLFVFMPVLFMMQWMPVHPMVPLVLLFVYCFIILYRQGRLTRNHLSMDAPWGFILVRFAIITACIVLYLHLTAMPMLADVKSNPRLLSMILLYPFLSAFPQELIFREFFFHRYKDILTSPRVIQLVNIVLFSFAHIYFANGIVLLFTLIGGAIFVHTFHRTRSLLVVTIEHSLYGLVILSSGLSEYFYKAF